MEDKSFSYHLPLTIAEVVSRQFIKRTERKYLLTKLFIAKILPSSQVSNLLVRLDRYDLADNFRAPKTYFIITWDIKTVFTRFQVDFNVTTNFTGS